MNLPETFGDQLRELRGDLSVRGLGKLANVPHSLIVSLENGKRSAGSVTANKLADAFKLRGQKRTQFLKSAETTTLRNRFSPDIRLKSYVEQVTLDLICSLTALKPDQIKEFIIGDQISYDFLVLLNDETVIGIEVQQGVIYVTQAPSAEKLPFPKDLHKCNYTRDRQTEIRRIMVP